jgi:hypothetical protein
MKAINGGIDGGAEVRSDDGEIIARVKGALKRQDKSSWEVADGFAELSRRGWTQTKIAETFAVSQSTVSRHIACSRNYAVTHSRPPFWTAYKEVDGHAGAYVPPVRIEQQGEPKKIKLKITNTTTPEPQKIPFKATRVPLGSRPATAMPPPMSPPEEELKSELRQYVKELTAHIQVAAKQLATLEADAWETFDHQNPKDTDRLQAALLMAKNVLDNRTPIVGGMPPAGSIKVRGKGIERAAEAINCLRRIPRGDLLRQSALQQVADWIRRNVVEPQRDEKV